MTISACFSFTPSLDASGNFCGRDPEKTYGKTEGFLNGPLCAIYGITAVFMTRYLYELQSSPVFLFLGV